MEAPLPVSGRSPPLPNRGGCLSRPRSQPRAKDGNASQAATEPHRRTQYRGNRHPIHHQRRCENSHAEQGLVIRHSALQSLIGHRSHNLLGGDLDCTPCPKLRGANCSTELSERRSHHPEEVAWLSQRHLITTLGVRRPLQSTSHPPLSCHVGSGRPASRSHDILNPHECVHRGT
jgi:hypothetical protein